MQDQTAAVPVRDVADAFSASLAGALATILSAIPRLLGFALVLIVGWILSSLLARGLTALLHAVKFNELARRSGLAGFVANMGVRTDSSGAIASLGKWFVRLITLVVAFDMLGLPAVSSVLQQLLLWLPNLVVGLVVLVIGGLAANAVSRLVGGATAQAGFTNPDILASVAKVAVWSFAIVVAVNQLGIATALINTLLVGVVGALALASGLAFGLGGRDRAAQLIEQWGRWVDEASPRIERAAQAVGTQARAEGMRLSSRRDGADGWTERSGHDRRRVGRPGRDRRDAGNGAAS